jgi:hypothetical protein
VTRPPPTAQQTLAYPPPHLSIIFILSSPLWLGQSQVSYDNLGIFPPGFGQEVVSYVCHLYLPSSLKRSNLGILNSVYWGHMGSWAPLTLFPMMAPWVTYFSRAFLIQGLCSCFHTACEMSQLCGCTLYDLLDLFYLTLQFPFSSFFPFSCLSPAHLYSSTGGSPQVGSHM